MVLVGRETGRRIHWSTEKTYTYVGLYVSNRPSRRFHGFTIHGSYRYICIMWSFASVSTLHWKCDKGRLFSVKGPTTSTKQKTKKNMPSFEQLADSTTLRRARNLGMPKKLLAYLTNLDACINKNVADAEVLQPTRKKMALFGGPTKS